MKLKSKFGREITVILVDESAFAYVGYNILNREYLRAYPKVWWSLCA